MTEPNKELPKEVVEELKNEHIYETFIARHAAKIAQSHYAPIIEDLKQKYDQSDREADHWESKYIMSDAKVQAQSERIAELEAELKKVMGLLKGILISSSLDNLIARAKIKRIDINAAIDEYWENVCKENGIDLGGRVKERAYYKIIIKIS